VVVGADGRQVVEVGRPPLRHQMMWCNPQRLERIEQRARHTSSTGLGVLGVGPGSEGPIDGDHPPRYR